MAKKKQKKKKSSVRGIYFALIIWLICSESLPMYTLGGILGAAAITIAGAALLSRLFGGKKKEEHRRRDGVAAQFSHGGPSLQSIWRR